MSVRSAYYNHVLHLYHDALSPTHIMYTADLRVLGPFRHWPLVRRPATQPAVIKQFPRAGRPLAEWWALV
eukprot:1180287-Prorocentrum_minimum.AAC.2